MKPRVLLINPPIYDFSAYDFWLKPLGLLTVAGYLRPFAEMVLFDYLDRPGTPDGETCRRWVNLDEPLNHNKTAFPISLLGNEQVNLFKDLCRQLNRTL